MSNQDLKPMDLSLLERVNPIYNTAKMSLCGLAMSGDRDAEAVKKGMETCAYWKIELADDAKPAAEEQSASDFTVRATQKESRLDLRLSGRLDTLTAPMVLELFEKTSKDTAISNVFVDCSKLQYISSAGLPRASDHT